MIYLDYAAHTAPDPEIFEIMDRTAREFPANPNAHHALGKAARTAYEACIRNILDACRLETYELILTSGATESNNLALKGAAKMNAGFGRHILTGPLEHSSVTGTLATLAAEGFEVETLPVDEAGKIDLDALRNMLRPDTILVTVGAVNSETGIIQNLKAIGKTVHENGDALFHTDATQAFGKLNLYYRQCDLITLSAHKIFGPTAGAGALIKHPDALLKREMDGGISMTPYRSATPDLGMMRALEHCVVSHYESMEKNFFTVRRHLAKLTDFFRQFPTIQINTRENPYLINLSTAVDGERLTADLARQEIYLSTKSACVASAVIPPAVYALTGDKKRAKNSFRLSLSPRTTDQELLRFMRRFTKTYKRLLHE